MGSKTLGKTPNGNSDFVPAWMAELGVKAGEWLNMSKAQLLTLQRPDRPLKIQVWATGMLHSSGYQTQEATTMRNKKKVPLTPGDIIAELFGIAKEHYAEAGINPTKQQIAALKEEKEHIRRVLVDLEADGVAMRTDAKGTPLRELSPDQLRRLPSGRTRMYFWLIPRAPNPETVAREWAQRQAEAMSPHDPSGVEGEVAKKWLPHVCIPKILKALEVGVSEILGEIPEKEAAAKLKAALAKTEYHETLLATWKSARMAVVVKLREIMAAEGEVATEGLPVEVAAGPPPEVASERGALESKVERYIEEESSSSKKEAPTTTTALPAQEFHRILCRRFQDAGKPVPTRKQADAIFPSLTDDAPAFLDFLTPKKMKAVNHPGALPSLLDEFRTGQSVAPLAEAPTSDPERDIRRAQLILENSDDPLVSEDDKEWARSVLEAPASRGAGS